MTSSEAAASAVSAGVLRDVCLEFAFEQSRDGRHERVVMQWPGADDPLVARVYTPGLVVRYLAVFTSMASCALVLGIPLFLCGERLNAVALGCLLVLAVVVLLESLSRLMPGVRVVAMLGGVPFTFAELPGAYFGQLRYSAARGQTPLFELRSPLIPLKTNLELRLQGSMEPRFLMGRQVGDGFRRRWELTPPVHSVGVPDGWQVQPVDGRLKLFGGLAARPEAAPPWLLLLLLVDAGTGLGREMLSK